MSKKYYREILLHFFNILFPLSDAGKIKLVKNMLIYSQYSYREIASYLGFTSPSYLGRKFKQATGLTLHQYREKYGVKEFNPEGHE